MVREPAFWCCKTWVTTVMRDHFKCIPTAEMLANVGLGQICRVALHAAWGPAVISDLRLIHLKRLFGPSRKRTGLFLLSSVIL